MRLDHIQQMFEGEKFNGAKMVELMTNTFDFLQAVPEVVTGINESGPIVKPKVHTTSYC